MTAALERGGVVSSTPRPHLTPCKEQVPILQEAGWAPGPVRTGGKSRPHRDSIPGRPAYSQSLYQLSYPAHTVRMTYLFCCGKAISVTYSEGVFVAFIFQYAMHMRRNFIRRLSGYTVLHIVLSTTWFSKQVIEHKMCVLIFSTVQSETFFVLRRTEQDMIKNVC